MYNAQRIKQMQLKNWCNVSCVSSRPDLLHYTTNTEIFNYKCGCLLNTDIQHYVHGQWLCEH